VFGYVSKSDEKSNPSIVEHKHTKRRCREKVFLVSTLQQEKNSISKKTQHLRKNRSLKKDDPNAKSNIADIHYYSDFSWWLGHRAMQRLFFRREF
jgi:hypothetical protein